MPVTLSYPKPRELYTKTFAYARTDSATEKCWLPKDSVVLGVTIITSAACDGTTGTVSVGYSGGGTELVNAHNVSTNDAGVFVPGAAAGSALIAGTKNAADKKVVATFTAGDSTSGGAGFVVIQYVVPGPGETISA